MVRGFILIHRLLGYKTFQYFIPALLEFFLAFVFLGA